MHVGQPKKFPASRIAECQLIMIQPPAGAGPSPLQIMELNRLRRHVNNPSSSGRSVVSPGLLHAPSRHSLREGWGIGRRPRRAGFRAGLVSTNRRGDRTRRPRRHQAGLYVRSPRTCFRFLEQRPPSMVGLAAVLRWFGHVAMGTSPALMIRWTREAQRQLDHLRATLSTPGANDACRGDRPPYNRFKGLLCLLIRGPQLRGRQPGAETPSRRKRSGPDLGVAVHLQPAGGPPRQVERVAFCSGMRRSTPGGRESSGSDRRVAQTAPV